MIKEKNVTNVLKNMINVPKNVGKVRGMQSKYKKYVQNTKKI